MALLHPEVLVVAKAFVYPLVDPRVVAMTFVYQLVESAGVGETFVYPLANQVVGLVGMLVAVSHRYMSLPRVEQDPGRKLLYFPMMEIRS
jgi:hypothetical protein